MCRLTWAELCGQVVDIREADSHIATVEGTIVIDARAIFDALTSQLTVQNMIEKRTAVELLAYLKDSRAVNTQTRWVHGDANLSDAMTKEGHGKRILQWLRQNNQRWSVVDDPESRSAKKRQAAGITPLQQREEQKSFLELLTNALENYHHGIVTDPEEEAYEEVLMTEMAQAGCLVNNNFWGV